MSAVSTLNALRNVLSRWWMHDSLWLNDPDCLMVRDTDTALTPDEVRTLATVIALSGGMVLDSDNLRKLSDENRRVISMSLPVYGKCAVPFDLFTAQGTPQFFELDCRTHRMLGVFNWDEHATDVAAPLSNTPTHVFDVWAQRYAGAHSRETTIRIPAHGCALLRLSVLEDRPQVIGSTFHMLQGAVEIKDEVWAGRTLSLKLLPVAKAEGWIFIAVPARFRNVSAPDLEVSRLAEDLVTIHLGVDKELQVRVEFS